MKALRIVSGNDTGLRQLYELIRPEPAFTSEILRLANSALFSFSKDITSVLQASMLLGFNRLKNIIVTIGLGKFADNTAPAALQACWHHTLACAIIAEESSKWGPVDKDFAFTAGIMHDIGRLSLASTHPEPYTQLIESVTGQDCNMLQKERELFGVDHCQAGRSLVEAWRLPRLFIDVTSRHHDTSMLPEDATAIVRRSCRLADAVGFCVFQPATPRVYAEDLADFPDGARLQMPDTEEKLTAMIRAKIRSIETL